MTADPTRAAAERVITLALERFDTHVWLRPMSRQLVSEAFTAEIAAALEAERQAGERAAWERAAKELEDSYVIVSNHGRMLIERFRARASGPETHVMVDDMPQAVPPYCRACGEDWPCKAALRAAAEGAGA